MLEPSKIPPTKYHLPGINGVLDLAVFDPSLEEIEKVISYIWVGDKTP